MPPVPLHKLLLSYPESFQSVSSYSGVESGEKTFSSHLSEPLLVAEGGSESRTGEWPAGWRSGWGLLSKVWLQLPGFQPWQSSTLPIQPHCSVSQGECSLIRSISAKPFRSDKYTDIAEKMMEGEKEIKFQLVQEEL